MSMNKYMHPRNIYKLPPDFKKMALEFPEFKPFVRQELDGKVTFDFKDLKSLRALTCTLLKKDFQLIVDIPLNKLIPTVPLRLNYILWLEDLLKIVGKSEKIAGIDIGTGASCIYPLLAAKKNNWSMLATEKDIDSYKYAKNNVERNCLQDLIQVVKIEEEKLLEEVIGDKEYDFCMCNPPFFASSQELHPFFKSRKTSRPYPKNAFCASVNEVVSKGGEVEFITRLIIESKVINKKIKIYSTMIGHKSSLPPLKKALRDANVMYFKESYFCQGNTTRWGLAWTFCKEFDLRKIVDPLKEMAKINKVKDPLIYPLPLTNVSEYSLNAVSEQLLKLFKELQMVTEEVSRNSKVLRYFVSAFSDTWSHQRRKRRQKIKTNGECYDDCDVSDLKKMNQQCDVDKTFESASVAKNNNNNIDTSVESSGKRIHNECFDGTFIKKLKISTDDGETTDVFFKFMFAVRLEERNINIELNCVEDNENREYLHQILQYVKNHLKI